MAYEVTATRRRPQRFEDMVGQDFVVATLQKSIEAGKIAHAYLFSGPRGCGKTTSARILAKALNCETGPTMTPCGTCPACIGITRGSSLDVIEIDGASNTSVNDVRQIKDEVQFPPNSCKYKIYIIDEVHMLSNSAFNALLKTIEEPPPYVIFIFATTELHKVPATIKSRCQQFNFRLVSMETLKTVLAETCEEIGLAAEDEALYWIARKATGSVRDAYTLFDQVAAFSDGSITFEKIRDTLSLVGFDRINSLMELCAGGKRQESMELLDSILEQGVSVDQFTIDCAEYLRSLLLLKSGIQRESLLGQSAERFSSGVLSTWSPIQLEQALSLFLQLYRDLRYSLDPRYELELVLSRLSWLVDYVSPIDVKEAVFQARAVLKEGGSGPFRGADLSTLRSETVRDVPENAEDITTSLDEQTIENPFADFKKRILGGASAGAHGSQGFVAPIAPVENSSESGNFVLSAHTEGSIIDEQEIIDSPDDQVLEVTNPSDNVSASGDYSDVIAEEFSGSKSQPIPLSRLQEELVLYFQESKHMISTSLAQSSNWRETSEGIEFEVDKLFIHNYLEQEIKLITEAASKFLGKRCSISIRVIQQKEEKHGREAAVPPSVEIVCKLFRGTLVGEGK